MRIVRKDFVADGMMPTKECHASTLVEDRNGRIMIAWFGGTREGQPDVRIWFSVLDNGRWSEPRTIAAVREVQHWNPVLFYTDENTLTLYYKVGTPIAEWQTYYTETSDFGQTWTEPRELVEGDVDGGRGPVKNKPIFTREGRLLAPASVENVKPWRAFVDIFDGCEWQKSEIPTREGDGVSLIQPTLFELKDGSLGALMRSDGERVYISRSYDGGLSWSEARPTELPNNNSGIDCTIGKNGELFVVCNPVGKNWGVRTPLSVYSSRDGGESFEHLVDLETAEGEYSYPAMISVGNGIAVSYTHKRERVAFAVIEL